MSNNTYNGWTNRATWLVNVWFNPETIGDIELAKETLENAMNEMPDYMRDFVCINEINWNELEAHCDNECEDDEQTED